MRLALFCCVLAAATAARCASLHEKWSYAIEKNQSFVGGPVAFSAGAGAKPDRLAIATSNNEVLAFSGKGQMVWRARLGGKPADTPAVADLDGDGTQEILVADDAPEVACLSAAGQTVWSTPLPADPAGQATAGDVAASPGLEVIVPDDGNGITCLSARGKILWRALFNTGKRPGESDPFIGPIGFWWPRYRDDDMGASATISNVDGRGKAEILAPSDDRHTYCISGDGAWKWDIAAQQKFHTRPVAADLDGDGLVEVLAGCLDWNVYCAEGATGRVLWEYKCEFGLDSALTAADLDGDGKLEVLAGDKKCFLHCIDASGKARWKLDLHPVESIKYYDDRMLAPPAVADINGDGKPEIIVGISKDQFLYIVSSEGRILDKYEMEQGPEVFLADSGIPGPVAVGDLDNDGAVEIAAAARRTALRCLSTGAPWKPAARAAPPVRAAAAATGAAPGAAMRVAVAPALYLGDNGVTVTASGRAQGPFVSEAVVKPPAGPYHVLVEHLMAGSMTSVPRFSATEPGKYDISARLIEESSRTPGPRLRRSAWLKPGAAEKDLAAKAEVALHDAAERLEAQNPGGARWMRCRVADLASESKDLAEALARRGDPNATQEAADLRSESERAIETAHRLAALCNAGADTKLIAWEANPWERFLDTALPPAEAARFSGLSDFTYMNEYESLAFNLANFSGESLELRFITGALAGPQGEAPSRGRVILREVEIVPREDGQYSSDALSLLAEGEVLTLPNAQSKQMWMTLRTKGLAPGRYSTTITVRSLTTKAIEKKIALAFDVLPIALPAKSPVSFCNWAYVETQMFKDMPDAAVADLVDHYTNVFPTSMFVTVKYDSDGKLLPIDWARFDELVRRYKDHGRFLFQGWDPLQHQGEAPEKEGAREKAFTAWMRALAQHMRQLGVGYEGWAIYITDEPGLDRGPRIEYVIENGKRIRQADPDIRIYTDPVNEMAIPDLERIAPYIDIWCPNQETFFPISDPKPETQAQKKLAFFKSTGGDIWMYECHPRAKRLRPDGYYRNQAWLAWKLGITGMGFWVYDVTQYDMWDAIPGQQEYVLVYPSPTGPVPSKRWEACREGIEDYMYLYLLREAAAAVEKTNPALASGARRLMDEAVTRVFGSRINYDVLMSYRRKIAEMTLRLRGLASPL